MSKPATEARLAAAAKGFTQVIGRGNAHIITKNPTTGKCCYDGQVGGGWHYNGDQETDTAWQAGTAPWNWQMVKANYNVFALSQFNQGQIIKWVDPGSGQYVTFQPMALQWTNNLNQIQQISMPQSVAAQVSDDILYWPAAYGSGRNFRYQASPLRLNKQLIIDSPSALPTTTYDTLELNFIIAVSSGVNIMVNGAAWGKKSTKDTVNSIAFQLPGGAVLWSFAVPTAYDSSGTIEGSITGSMRLKKRGNSLYVSVRFSKSWIDTAVFPIVIDPTVDYQVGASGNDCMWDPYGAFFSTYPNLNMGGRSKFAVRFASVTIPDGATIDTSYLSFRYYSSSGTPPVCTLSAEDAANPSQITSRSDGASRTLTTNNIEITSPTSGGWWNSDSLNTIIDELMSYSYASGSAMQFIVVDTLNSSYGAVSSYDHYSGYAPKLHIEYTEASTDLEPALIGGKLIFGGLTLNGLVGR